MPPTTWTATFDPSEEFERGVDDRGRSRPGLEIGDHRQRRGTRVIQLVGQLAHQLRAVRQHERAALCADPPCGPLADPLPGTGDQDHLAGEPPWRDEPGATRFGDLPHRPPGGLLGPLGVHGDQGAGALPVTVGERLHDVEVVERASRVDPRRVAQRLLHVPLDAECLVGPQQVLVAGEHEQVVVERRVGLGVRGRVDEPVALDVGHGGLGQHPVAGELLMRQSADGQLERPELQRPPCIEIASESCTDGCSSPIS